MRNTKAGRGQNRASGFSLLEMMMVIAIILIVGRMTFVSLVPLLNQQHVTNAYNITLAAMRQARDNAVAQRTSYSLTFTGGTTPPNTITVQPTLLGFQGDQSTVTYTLPTDVFFLAQGAVSSTPPPDSGAGANFGTGSNSIDFGYTANGNAGGTTQNTIYFCPDGSAQVASTCAGAGNWDDGVVYIARAGDLMSSRAITLWGGTGRIHGWRFYTNGSGGYQWVRQ